MSSKAWKLPLSWLITSHYLSCYHRCCRLDYYSYQAKAFFRMRSINGVLKRCKSEEEWRRVTLCGGVVSKAAQQKSKLLLIHSRNVDADSGQVKISTSSQRWFLYCFLYIVATCQVLTLPLTVSLSLSHQSVGVSFCLTTKLSPPSLLFPLSAFPFHYWSSTSHFLAAPINFPLQAHNDKLVTFGGCHGCWLMEERELRQRGRERGTRTKEEWLRWQKRGGGNKKIQEMIERNRKHNLNVMWKEWNSLWS